MKTFIKKVFWKGSLFIGINQLFMFINREKFAIIMYHGIIDQDLPMPCWWQLSFEEFKYQIEYLKTNYHISPLRDILKKLGQNEALPPNTAAITFDDGYFNNASIAYPFLKHLNIPSTVFLVTDFIGTDKLLWPDELYMDFVEAKNCQIDLSAFNLGICKLADDISERSRAFHDLCEILKEVDLDKKKAIISQVKLELSPGRYSPEAVGQFKLLDWNAVDQIRKEGLMDFAPHTCTHEILSRLDDAKLKYEIEGSCNAVNHHEQIFAYPNGRSIDFDDRSKTLLRSLNVKAALSTISGLNTRQENMYELKRLCIGNDTSLDEFKLMCSGITDMRSLNKSTMRR